MESGTAEGAVEREDGASSSGVRLLVVTLCAVQFIDVLATTVVIVALPAIQADLGLSDGARERVAAIYALLFGALLLLAGRLADAWGARRLFIAGLIAFGAGSVTGGLAPNGVTLIVGRGVQGIGAALAVPAALAMVAGLFPPGAGRNRVLGYWAAAGAVGGAAGFALGGVITDLVNWRWTLLLNVPPILLATVAMLLIRVPEPAPARATIPLSRP
jgi:MFS family permease